MWIPSGPSCWRRITLGNLNLVLVLMSSPCLKGEENTSNSADPTTSNLPENRGRHDVIRHFPGLGILTKMPHAAFSSPICGRDSVALVSQRRRSQAALAHLVHLSRACPRDRHLLVSDRHS